LPRSVRLVFEEPDELEEPEDADEPEDPDEPVDADWLRPLWLF
jgi:hypothetical protein